MPGRAYTELFDVAADQYGFVTQRDAINAGYSKTALRDMARRGAVQKRGWGLYRFNAFPPHALDQYMEATLWPRPAGGVLSHETALDLHDLCDVNPGKIHVTVPERWRTNRDVPALYVLHRRDLDPREVIYHEGIPIVTAARAILDGIETNVRADLVEQAIDTARRRGLIAPEQLELIEDQLTPA